MNRALRISALALVTGLLSLGTVSCSDENEEAASAEEISDQTGAAQNGADPQGAMQALEQVPEFKPVSFPPVPEGWTQKIQGLSVEYHGPKKQGKKDSDSIVRITYSRSTSGLDAQAMIDAFVKKFECNPPDMIGKGFYTASCPANNSYVIVIGEINNAYQIELEGLYDKPCQALIEGYIREIISGKHVFNDRYIGDIDKRS